MKVRRWFPGVLLVAVAVLAARCPGGDDDDSSPPSGTPDASALGPTGGSCVTPCQVKEDCCSGSLCETSLFHYACSNNACVQLGCITDADCSELPGGQCASTGSFNLCGVGCAAPTDCCPPLPPGVSIPEGQDSVQVAFDGGAATFYRCGVYPQKFMCAGTITVQHDAGTVGVCLRICNSSEECPGIPVGTSDAGVTLTTRVDAGFLSFPLGDGGVMRAFQQQCVSVFGPVGQCAKGCQTDSDCCGAALGTACQSYGTREVCVQGACVSDGCRSDAECTAKGTGTRCAPR